MYYIIHKNKFYFYVPESAGGEPTSSREVTNDIRATREKQPFFLSKKVTVKGDRQTEVVSKHKMLVSSLGVSLNHGPGSKDAIEKVYQKFTPVGESRGAQHIIRGGIRTPSFGLYTFPTPLVFLKDGSLLFAGHSFPQNVSGEFKVSLDEIEKSTFLTNFNMGYNQIFIRASLKSSTIGMEGFNRSFLSDPTFVLDNLDPGLYANSKVYEFDLPEMIEQAKAFLK